MAEKKDFDQELQSLIKREITKHWKILFDGNGYGDEWKVEAEKRGLHNYKNTPEAMEHYLEKQNVKLYTEMGIYSEDEMKHHYDVKLEKYCKMLNIEVGTMLEMIHADILPAAFGYMKDLAETYERSKSWCTPTAIKNLFEKLSKLTGELSKDADELEKLHAVTKSKTDYMERAKSYAEKILPFMEKTRAVADEIEPLLGQKYRPYPTYEDLLFSNDGFKLDNR